jgi:cytosine/adenosine deaminase-related metal-dependent hydrolase
MVHPLGDVVLMPGLVNAHTHLELTHFPAWKLRKGVDYAPRTYVDWVIQVIKIKRALGNGEREHSLREGIRKSIEAGTTCVGEIVSDPGLASVYAAYPFAGRLYLEAIGQSPEHGAAVLVTLQQGIDECAAGDVRTGVSPHAPHTLSAQLMGEVAGLARTNRVPSAIHLSESPEEAQFLHDSTGRIAELLYPHVGWDDYIPAPRRTTSTAWLHDLHVLDPMTTVIHCVHVTPADVEILKRSGASAVLCPRSNDRLAVGTAPASLLKHALIPLALGTDSLASNDSLSLWDEMRFCRRCYPGIFSPDELLEMATRGGARALHLDDITGSLEAGKRADFLAVRLPGRIGAGELTEALLESGTLLDTFIGGASSADR